MSDYAQCLGVLEELFRKDCLFSLATAKDNIPSVRVVDTYYEHEAFWIVTYAKSQKVIEIESNPNVALCHNFYSFRGKAFNVGHPLNENHKEIRAKLIVAFQPWYFAHNNEDDEHMCYVKFVPETGFFYQNGTGYKANFLKKEVEQFPFESPIDFEQEKI